MYAKQMGAKKTKVHVERKPNEQCVLDFTPITFEGNSEDFKSNYMKDPTAGVYGYKDRKYISKRLFERSCSMIDDI